MSKFVPGQSGNPGGRSRASRELAEAVREHGPGLIERLVSIAGGSDPKAAVAACRELLDRGYGKAPQQLDDGDGGPAKIVVTWQKPE